MIDLVKMEELLNMPDETPAEDRRTAILSVLALMKESNDAETATADKYKQLETENQNLKKQNVDLYNRVAKTIIPAKQEDVEPEKSAEQKNDELLEQIRRYY